MKHASWHLSRRTFLRSTSGLALTLPWLECMASDPAAKPAARFFAGYFHYGVPMPADDDPARLQVGWFPLGTGRDYQLPDMHQHSAGLRDKLTYLSGLDHPRVRGGEGHRAADTFLTGSLALKDYSEQTISIDQHVAGAIGGQTRYQSIVLSSEGGIGRQGRTATLSFDKAGRPIPGMDTPRDIFRRLFGAITPDERRAIHNRAGVLDQVLEEAQSLDRRLGVQDRRKLDEYLSSVRDLEVMTERSAEWLETPKPAVNLGEQDVIVPKEEPRAYLELMYRLAVLTLQTDSARVVSFQVAPESDAVKNFPKAVGINANAHTLSHSRDDFTNQAKYLTFLNELHYSFLRQLDSIQEGDGTLLDNTISFYGCSTSSTHQSSNYPIVLSGGRNLGLRHGAHLDFAQKAPLSNLFVTLANQLAAPTERFADSTGAIQDILA